MADRRIVGERRGEEPAATSPQRALLTGGEAVVRSLEHQGVRHVFGIPGDHTLPIYAALADSSLAHVTVRHEQGAGFMADGYARASGEPGVALVVSGPGLTNIATALGEAYADGVALLVISAEIPSGDIGRSADHFHELKDQLGMARAIAWSERVTEVAEIPAAIGRAFTIFREGRPRAVHIGIPTDVLARTAVVDMRPRTVARPHEPEAGAVERAGALLAGARLPLLLLGGGARRAVAAAVRLAEATGAPVMTTWGGMDAFPGNHPLSVGCGLHLSAGLEALNGADVVLAVGTQLGRSDFWFAPASVTGRLIRVDVDPDVLSAGGESSEVALLGDARASLEAIGRSQSFSGRSDGAARASALRASIDAEADRRGARYAPWLRAFRAGLPNDAILAFDSSTVTYLGFRYVDIPLGGSWLYPSAFGTLGYALPAAIGARLAQPHRAAGVLIGDGGLLFTCSELLTATERGLGLAVVVWNDRGFGSIRLGMREAGIRQVGVDFAIPDIAALATAFGGSYARPATPLELTAAVREASARRAPTLIEVDDRLAG